jgi:hypothetical protein
MKYLPLLLLLLIRCNDIRSEITHTSNVIDRICEALKKKDVSVLRAILVVNSQSTNKPPKVPFYHMESQFFLENPDTDVAFSQSILSKILFDTEGARSFLRSKDVSSFHEAFLKGEIQEKCIENCGGNDGPFIVVRYEKYKYMIFLSCKKQNSRDCAIGYLEINYA